MQTNAHETLYFFFTTKKIRYFSTSVAKMRLVGSNSQVHNYTLQPKIFGCWAKFTILLASAGWSVVRWKTTHILLLPLREFFFYPLLHSSLRHCIAPRPHLQAAAIAAWQTHGSNDHGDGWQSQLYPHHRKQQKQATTPQERRPTGICPGAPSLQHLHLWPTVSRKHAYADDLAIMHADGDWLAVEKALSKDMATVSTSRLGR